MLLGTMPGRVTLESIYQRIAEHAPELEALDVQIAEATRMQSIWRYLYEGAANWQ